MKLMRYEEWIKSVHQVDGLSERVENELRKDIVTFMIIFGTNADLGTSAIAKAVFIFHKFSKLRSFKKINFMLYASVCIFISAKFDDNPVKLDAIARMFLTMNIIYQKIRARHPLGTRDLDPNDFPLSIYRETTFEQNTIQLACETFTTAEAEILSDIGYDLDIDLPYYYIQSLEEKGIMVDEELLDIATAVINKSWRTILCLYYEPKVIALAALACAQEITDHAAADNISKIGSSWMKSFGEFDGEEVKEVTKYLKELN